MGSTLAMWTAGLLVVGFLAGNGNALPQVYCSSENTGSGFTPVTNQFQSTGACFDTCKQNYAFAVLQGQECWCSNYIPADQTSISDCSTGCPGINTEQCGNSDTDLYGYVALTISPSGTAGSSSPTTVNSQTSSKPASSTDAPSSTTESTTSSTVESPSSTADPLTTSTAETSTTPPPSTITAVVTITSTPTSTTPSATSTTSSIQSVTDTPTTNTQIVTVSGAVVTQTVTSTPRPQSTSSSSNERPQKSNNSMTPVIVGAVVGSVGGLAAIALVLFCCLRRGSDSKRVATTGAMKRNASVLSKSGLLSMGHRDDPEKSMEETRYGSQRQSALYNDDGENAVTAPGSAHQASGPALVRRDSRPLVYDQRLNPAALMENWQMNGSRSSVGTMQDQRDYSRPLGITNPDPDDK